MAKRTNRVAWGLVVLLAAVLLGGCWLLLANGILLAGVRVQVSATDGWRTDRPRVGVEEPARGGWEVTRTTNLGFFGVAITRFEPYGTSDFSIRSNTEWPR